MNTHNAYLMMILMQPAHIPTTARVPKDILQLPALGEQGGVKR
jgi:hypothetical protein